MRSLSLLAAVLLVAAPVLAQRVVVLTPGHPDLALNAFTIGDEQLEVRIVEPRMQAIGTVTQTVTEDGAYVTIVTDTDVPMAGQVSRDSLRLLRATLAPALLATTAQGETATATFDALRVVGSYGPEGRTLPIDLDLKAPVFAAGTVGLVARALPFREGYTAVVPTFSPTRRLVDYTLTVAGREDAERPDGTTVSAWTVEESSTGRGSQDRRHLIDPETRDILQTTFTPQPGTVIAIGPAGPADAEEADVAPAVVLRPGDAALSVDALQDYEEAYAIRVVQPVQQDAGTATRRLTIDEGAGTITLVTTLNVPMAGQVQTDSLVAAYPSLAPISQTSTGSGGAVTLTYADGRVVGTVAPTGGDAETIDVALEDPVFDASWLSEVARVLPLAEGYRATFLTYSPEGVTNVDLAVTGQETVGGSTAWIIEATPAEGPSSMLAIDVETRELLRTQIQPQLGVLIEIVPE